MNYDIIHQFKYKDGRPVEPLDVIGSCIRSAFRAAPGHKLIICDLSAIENRVLGYICRALSIIKVFKEKLDPYKYFAVDLYHKKYEEISKLERQNAKPPVLGCLGMWTPVLTDSGWKPILAISPNDLVFDGECFVSHKGKVYQGDKNTINIFGMNITPDHLILTKENEWQQSENVNIQIGQQALDLAIGKLLNLLDLKEIIEDTNATVYVVLLKKLIYRIWKTEKRHPAFHVPIKKYVKNVGAFTSSLNTSREMLLTDLLTDIMLFCRAVVVLDQKQIVTQGEALLANFQMYTVLFGTLTHWKDLIILLSNWIEQTMTVITNKEISDSLQESSITIIKKILDMWSGMAKSFQLLNLGIDTVLNTEMLEPWPESFAGVYHQNKSLSNKKTVVVPTYDILDAGPFNRFMIMSNQGPLIVHNCGYGLSGGEEKTSEDGDIIYTGLMKYGRSMGIAIDKELADRSVEVFRKKHWEVVNNWDDLDNAAKLCIRTGKSQTVNDIILFELIDDVLRATLPSGRSLHYLQPKIVDRPWFGNTKKTIEYWGMNQELHQYGRVYTYGSKLLENFDQSISRDLLVHGMKLATKMGFPIIMHTHDEIVAEVPINSTIGIKELRECMIQKPSWGNDQLLLDAAGFESAVYRKE